jgi:hypothetical protein
LGTLILAVALLAWSTVLEIKKDLKLYLKVQGDCRAELPDKYAQWEHLCGPEGIITKIEKSREKRWDEYDSHKHDSNSGVVIKPPRGFL